MDGAPSTKDSSRQREVGSVRTATLELSTLVKSFGTSLSFQRAAGTMWLNLADCDGDFRNDFWPLAIFRGLVFSRSGYNREIGRITKTRKHERDDPNFRVFPLAG
jgi:hypothetical protein